MGKVLLFEQMIFYSGSFVPLAGKSKNHTRPAG
jgi:hypothetical protein